MIIFRRFESTAKLFLITAMILSFIVSAFPLNKVSAAEDDSVSMSFNDVSESHWANKFVTKLALQGIISGYEADGTFRPNDEVKRQDVLVMAVKFMGIDVEEYIGDIDFNIGPLDSQEYAKPYVYVAVREGLINILEEQSLLEDGESWGTESASREWVARVLIRALDKETTTETDLESLFSDVDDVAAWAYPYVNTAVDLGLLSGIDGQIAPKTAVTRAQMAAFLSQAEQYLDEHLSSVIVGRVISISSNSIQVQEEGEDPVIYSLHSAVKIYDTEENAEQISTSEIGQYDQVYLIVRNDEVYYIERLEDAELQTTEGKFIGVNRSDMSLTMLVDGYYEEYELSSSVAITDLDDNGLKLSDLVTGSTIRISQDPYDDPDEVIMIVVVRTPVNKTAEGEFVEIEGGNLSVIESSSDEGESFELSEDVVITYGERVIEESDLQPGDVIEYTVENDLITSVTLIDPVVPLLEKIQGYFMTTGYDSQLRKNYITLKTEDGQIITKYTVTYPTVNLGGAPDADLEDLLDQDWIEISINEDEEVVIIEILNRSIDFKANQTVLFYDEDSRRLLLEESNETFILDEETDITAYGDPIELDMADNYLEKNAKVDIYYTGNQVISIELSDSYPGYIEEIDTTNKELTISTEDGLTLTFEWSKTFPVYTSESSSQNVNSLKEGDQVEVVLDDDQQYISRVDLVQLRDFVVEDVEENYNRMEWYVDEKTLKSQYISGSTTILGLDGRAITLSDIEEGDRILVSYIGSTISEIRLAEAYFGFITSIDINNNKISIDTYEEGTMEVEMTSVSGLSINDRVQVVKDYELNSLVTKLEAEERTFWKYVGGSDNEFYVKKKSVNDLNYVYELDNVYLTADGEITQPTAFQEDDAVTLYFLNDDLIEIAKN